MKNKKRLKVLYITKNEMSARGLSVNKLTVKYGVQKKIILALTSKKAEKLIKKALSTVGGTKFVKAKQAEYANLNEL